MRAKHKDQAEWSEWVIKDDYLWTQYIQSAPGSKVSPRFHPDNREWWVILEGEIRFQIEGPHAAIAGGKVRAVRLEASSETAKPFLKRGDIDAPHELMPLIHVENQNALSGSILFLRRIRRAHVKISLGL